MTSVARSSIVAGRQACGFSVPGRRARDVAGDRDDELAADAAGDRVGVRLLRLVDDDLGDAVAVAQVEEDQLAVVAAAVDPARQPRVGARVGRPAGRRRCGSGRAWRGSGWSSSWPAYRT